MVGNVVGVGVGVLMETNSCCQGNGKILIGNVPIMWANISEHIDCGSDRLSICGINRGMVMVGKECGWG